MDATKKPLRIPPQFGVYAEKHNLFEMFRKLIEDLLIHKPGDPLEFLQEQLKRDDNDVPAIIIHGPTASGKTTISKMVCSSLRTAYISADNLLADDVSATAAEAKKHLQNNQPIPTDLWVKMIQARLQLYDCVKKGWVLDGFPETREQALALQAVGITAKHYVVLEAPDTVLIERQMGKRIDPQTKEIYHTTFDFPTNPDVESRLVEPPEGCSETSTGERLMKWHRFSKGLERCYEKYSKFVNADQPKADIFAQVLTFLKSKPRSLAPHTPRVILLGPTGSGKGVQAALLASKYNLVNVSSGQLVKEAVANESKMGEAMKPYVERGMLVPDNQMVKLLDERLSQVDCTSRGWVLRGFPRTREQAENLSSCGHEANRVFFLDVPNDSVYERLTLRSLDVVTGQRYHSLYNPPRTVEIKDRGLQQPKDAEEEVRQRLSAFYAYAEEIADFCEDAQHVNADQDPHTVFECIESMLVNPTPKKLDLDE
ncbi:putative adenylate kinase 8-like [Apostichopus japonicus]|uniref:Putative adenylate kinase 8-like n=1 Tax=Stichopus japonicus TaxID=307972 RepID=A0A2G8LEL9_STIJA|nr:putative adenylate kinase 8-like [Apostichopus japonicus]